MFCSSIWQEVIVSFLIVAFGQPSWIGALAPIAAAAGYGLFWRSAQGFLRPFLWYAALSAVQLSWFLALQPPEILLTIGYLLLCVLLGVQFALFTMLLPKLLTVPRILLAASWWTLLEYSRLYFLCGYTWNPAGLSLTSQLLSLQMAAVGGVLFLSFYVMLTNLFFLRAIREYRFIRGWAMWALCACIPYVFGALHIAYHERQEKQSPSAPLSIALVQPGLLIEERRTISPLEQWKRIVDLLGENGSYDLIVLPEVVVPRSHYSMAKQLADQMHAEVIAGFDFHDPQEDRFTNSALFFSPDKESFERYDKRVLVPFGEYIPFSWCRKIAAKIGIYDFYSEGKEAKVFSGKMRYCPSICYEETFSSLMREGRLKGAELLVNLTNDGWYPSSKLAEQHFAHARVRAVENGLAMVRTCNTGVSATIDSLGRIRRALSELDLDGKRLSGVVKDLVPTYHYQTLYVFWGDWGIISFCLVWVLGAALHRITTLVKILPIYNWVNR